MARALYGLLGAMVGSVTGCIVFALVTLLCCVNSEDGTLVFFSAACGSVLGFIAGIAEAKYMQLYLTRTGKSTSCSYRCGSIVTLLIGIASINVGMVQVIAGYRVPPTDQQLIAHFVRHQAKFNEAQEESRQTANLAYPSSSPGTTLLGQRRFGTFGSKGQPRQISFIHWRDRLAVSSHTHKGYAYLLTPPSFILRTLDNCGEAARRTGPLRAYRHLSGNWYLFYEYQVW